MSSPTFPPIPSSTQKAAQAVFGRSNSYLVIGDQVNDIFAGLSLETPVSSLHKPVHKLATLYLITIFQHWEALPDHLAVDSLQERVDWKYALHAPLKPFPLEASTLCEFRQILLADPASGDNLQRLLERLANIPQLASSEYLTWCPGQVIAHVCRISRLAKIWETINQALETVAITQWQLLRTISLPHWYDRYGHVRKTLNLRSSQQEQEAFAEAIGADGLYLLQAVSRAGNPELKELDAILALGEVWRNQFEFTDEGNVSWRNEACASCRVPGFMAHAMPDKSRQRIGGKNE